MTGVSVPARPKRIYYVIHSSTWTKNKLVYCMSIEASCQDVCAAAELEVYHNKLYCGLDRHIQCVTLIQQYAVYRVDVQMCFYYLICFKLPSF